MGIDDFAFKKRYRYGTIFIDLKTRKPIDILDSRTTDDVTNWLKRQPDLKLISRDGSRTYAKAVSAVFPEILQVADRWHILRQLFEATKQAICSILPAEWRPSTIDDGNEITLEKEVAKRKRDKVRIRHEEKHWSRVKQVQTLYEKNYTVTAITKKLTISRATVYSNLRIKEKPNHKRHSRFDFIRPTIQVCLQKSQSSTQIEKACREHGYTGSISTLNRFIAEERHRLKRTGTSKPLALRQKY